MSKEKEKIIKTVDVFCEKMKAKMLESFSNGWDGWDCHNMQDYLQKKLISNLIDKDFVDVANFAMMLDNLKRKESKNE